MYVCSSSSSVVSWTQVVDLCVQSVVRKVSITKQNQNKINQLLTQLYYDFW